MEDFLAALRERVNTATKEFEDARQALEHMQERVQALYRDLRGYQAALDAELRRMQPSLLLTPYTSDASQPEDALAPPIELLPRTEAVARLILESGDSGITPPQIYSSLLMNGIEIRRNYLYTILGRLKEQGRVFEHGRKYYPSHQLVEFEDEDEDVELME